MCALCAIASGGTDIGSARAVTGPDSQGRTITAIPITTGIPILIITGPTHTGGRAYTFISASNEAAKQNARGSAAQNCRDEMPARLGQRDAARLKHVATEEMSGDREAAADLGRRRFAVIAGEKSGQLHQLVAPSLAGLPRHRSAGFRRHIGKVRNGPGRGALAEVEAKTEFGQKRQFESGDQRTDLPCVAKPLEDVLKRFKNRGMRIALGQKPRQRRQVRYAVDGMRRSQIARGAQPQSLDGINAQMLVEARAPRRRDRIARL